MEYAVFIITHSIMAVCCVVIVVVGISSEEKKRILVWQKGRNLAKKKKPELMEENKTVTKENAGDITLALSAN